MTRVHKGSATANADQNVALQLANEIRDQFAVDFDDTDDGRLRGRCPVCESVASLYIDRVTDDQLGYSCSQCGISGFSVDDLTLELCAYDPGFDSVELLDPLDECDVDPERVHALRDFAADYFHGNLMELGDEVRFEHDNGWVSGIEYLTEVRGHAVETLHRFRVGLSLESLHDAAVDEGFSYTEMILAGLLRPSYRHYWNAGLLLFPHFREGHVSHFSQKDILGEFTHQARKEHRDPACLWFNQDASVDAVELVCVEGEHDVLSVFGKGRYDNVVGSNGSVSNDQIDFLVKLSGLQRLVLCFDNDSNGRKYTRKVAKGFRASDNRVSVVSIELPDGCKDIDDFLRESQDPEADFKSLLAAASPVPNPSIEMDSDLCRCLHNGKLISNFIIEIVYRIRTATGCERYVRFRNQAGKTTNAFLMEAKSMASVSEFKKFCLDKGDFLFTGTQTALDGLWEFHFDQDHGREIFEPSHVGYVAEHDCWLFGNMAVKDGDVYEADEFGIVWIGDNGFRPKDAIVGSGKDAKEATFAASRMIVLEEQKSEELIERTLDLFKQNLGFRGWLVLGWIYALLHAEEIFDRFGLFPGLFLYGKFQSGKDVLAGWILSFFGLPRTASQSFSETTQVAMNRLFAMFSCMPVWLDEFRHTDGRARWKYSFLRGAYNRTGAGKGVKDDPLAIRSVPIHGAALLSGEQLPGDPALRSRYVRIQLSRSERNDEVYEAIEELSDQFPAITVHWLRNKTPASARQLVESVGGLRRQFKDEHGWDDRTSEVYAVAIAGFLAIRNDTEFIDWAIQHVTQDCDSREHESVLSRFFEDLANLQSQGKLSGSYLEQDGRTLFIWHNGVYRIWQEDHRRRTSDEVWPWETIFDHLREEGCVVKHGDTGKQADWTKQKKLAGQNRRCVWIDLAAAPEFVRELAEAVRITRSRGR